MFDAVFILDRARHGARVARYLFQDVARHVWGAAGPDHQLA